jgi:Zn finger protein HypA/HybF involved in hydrogenase expression
MAFEKETPKNTAINAVKNNVTSSKEEMMVYNKVKPFVATNIQVKCLLCSHSWNYKGKSEKRIHCPKCGRQQVDYNRRRFGKWRP